MPFASLVVSVILVGVSLVVARDGQPQSPAPTEMTYAAFMALNDQQKRDRFAQFNAETKSVLMRTHANQWLDKNRTRLSASQIALMQEMIAYLSPEAYRNPSDPHIARRGQELTDKFKCQLRNSDVLAAIGPHRSPPSASWMNDVWFWFTACVIG
jgi:hypothetical protein